MVDRQSFRLQIIGPGLKKVFFIPIGLTTIGRDENCPIKLPDLKVSRHHAEIDCSPTGCWLTDLDSANGTLLNGQRISANVRMPLTDQMTLKIGPFTLSVEQIQEEIPSEKDIPDFSAALQSEGPTPLLPPPGPPPDGTKGEIELPLSSSNNAFPPGLGARSIRLLSYLPSIYQTDFMSRFLALFESILIPIEWNIDNFDLYLDPGTAPDDFIPWLANWFEIIFEPSWTNMQRRLMLKDAHRIYAMRGTRWSLSRVLEIYTGKTPEIIDAGNNLAPFTFKVGLTLNSEQVDRDCVCRLIDANKPAYSSYVLEIKE